MNLQQTFLVIIAVGGTGGHLYPAQVLAEELMHQYAQIKIVFVGHGLKTNRFFDQQRHSYVDIPSATLSFKKLHKLPKACHLIIRGIIQSLTLVSRKKPDLVIGFGSFHSMPILIAACLGKIPYILFEANAILGKVNKLFSKRAHLNAYQLFPLQMHSSSSFVKTQLPIHEDKLKKIAPVVARAYFGLQKECFTFLVFGGSQGAVSLNEIVLLALKICAMQGRVFQVIHLIGFNMDLAATEQFYAKQGIKACVKTHETQMNYAYSAADLFVGRAGANTVAEGLHHQIPALFVPYPYLDDDHQTANARYVCDEVQGGVVLSQKGLTPEILALHIQKFFGQEYYMQKKEALQRFKQEKSKKLSEVVFEIVNGRKQAL
jgi:UDP-N-acetylglucosamine--N-acetylmuramyl-(pentapeptide) pyrophosphoryl-undecaprenol N-acetylglucosamine transferase